MSLIELFCNVDDFCQVYEPKWKRQQLSSGEKTRNRTGKLSLSEIMTIAIYFHQSQYRNFKIYYTEYVMKHLNDEFPKLVSYPRFVHLQAQAVIPLSAYLQNRLGNCTGVSFVDSTALAVCNNRRIGRHRVFDGFAERGKTSMGWFYGFKLHIAVNDQGELLACQLTPGNVDDRKPVPALVKRIYGKLFGDRGYISKPLSAQLWQDYQVHLITWMRKNMKNHLMPLLDRILLRKRAIIETIIDQLKNISQIEHSRHRSVDNFLVNLLAGLIAYSLRPVKPAINWHHFGELPALIHN